MPGSSFQPTRVSKKPAEQRREVAVWRVAEHQPLRLHRARRIDIEPDAGIMPTAQGRRHVRIDVADQFAAPEAVVPDQPLQRLQRRRLLVGVDPVLQQADRVRRVEVRPARPARAPRPAAARRRHRRRGSMNSARCARAYGNSFSLTKAIEVAVPSTSMTIALIFKLDIGPRASLSISHRAWRPMPSSSLRMEHAHNESRWPRLSSDLPPAGPAQRHRASTRPCCRIASPSAISATKARSPRQSAPWSCAARR